MFLLFETFFARHSMLLVVVTVDLRVPRSVAFHMKIRGSIEERGDT